MMVQIQNKIKVLGVYAHPDDESFCVGGTLAKYAANGAEIMIVSFTHGEAGQIHDSHVASRQTLGQTRSEELVKACEQLGVHHVQCFDYGDGRLSDIPMDDLIAQITYIIRDFQPDVVLTFGEDGVYGHPDHIAVGAATDQAFHLAGNPSYLPEHLIEGLSIHTPLQLYHSYFPRQKELLLNLLASWLQNMSERFHGCTDYLRAIRIFAKSVSMLGYASDHVEIEWFAPDYAIIEQNEDSTSLYLILSGCVDVIRETDTGKSINIGELCAGQYFGETGLATNKPRNASIVARDGVSCLILSPQKEANFAGRGASASLKFEQMETTHNYEAHAIVVDTTDYVMHKVSAIASHRSQCPIRMDTFPTTIWQRLFDKEYFVSRYPITPKILLA